MGEIIVSKLSNQGHSIETTFDGMNKFAQKEDITDFFANNTIEEKGKTKK